MNLIHTSSSLDTASLAEGTTPRKMIYFPALPADSLKQIDELVRLYVPEHALEICRDMTGLRNRLCQPTDNVSVVLLAAGKDELEELQVLQEQLQPLRLVVILPDKNQEASALCGRLHPRFISYTSGNFSVVKSVLKNQYGGRITIGMPASATGRDLLTKHRSYGRKGNVRINLHSPDFF